MGEDEQKISNLWAELSPPIDKKHFHQTLSPEMLTDLLASSPCAEYLDIFTKRKFYDQSLSRYHISDDKIMSETEPVPTELSFLAHLYSGFNGTKLSSQQYHELNSQLENFPAQSLSRKIKNTNLNALRKTLFELDIHSEMMNVLRAKYFPQVPSGESVTVDQHLDSLGLSEEVRNMVRKCLQSSGRSEKTTYIKQYKENPSWKNKSEIDALCKNSDAQLGESAVTADQQMRLSHETRPPQGREPAGGDAGSDGSDAVLTQ